MPKAFKYDVIQLCQGVRDRPCLWNKSIENYKDRVERREAWEQIFTILDPNYEEMTAEEKRIMGEVVLYKWTNIRDTFVKTLKTKMGKPKRKYLLYDHLKFLIEVNRVSEYSTSIVDEIPTNSYLKTEKVEKEIGRKRRKVDCDEEYTPDDTTKEYCSNNDLDFIEVDDMNNDPRIMNEDEAFFASLLPTVVRYNEDERLEFRIEVLSVMKKIKDKRKWPGDD